jgi:hypothetical protein
VNVATAAFTGTSLKMLMAYIPLQLKLTENK